MWSLDELSVEIEVGGQLHGTDDDGFILTGLRLESATWEGNSLQLTPELSHPMPNSVLRWIRGKPRGTNMIALPVYLNNLRNKIIMAVKLSGGDRKSVV